MNRATAAVLTAALSGTLVFAGGSAATAAPAATVHATTSVVTSPAGLTSHGSVPYRSTVGGGDVSPQAVPIAVRLAVRVAMETLKRTSKTWYNAIVRQVVNGRTTFVNWWNNSVPGWVKNIFGGVSAAAIYDALLWVLGLD